ncbi:signal peptidase I [Cellulosimicrobium cellulans]|uniref:signal peptidase I n=1 Tax=Cellulosimicrobium cellulans TaxID=1710 RepID=UPI001651D57A|nr:signal peptidase I [Cellulosimicrobium cellulans]
MRLRPLHARPCTARPDAGRTRAGCRGDTGAAVERLARRVVDVAAVVGVLCAAAVVALLLAGWRPVVLLSGSMAPGMPAGTLVVTRPVPATAVRVGDVVTVPLAGSATPVTHRVAALRPTADGRVLATLRGDANAADDPGEYALPDGTRRAVVHVPRVGRLLTGVPGTVLTVGAGALVLLAALPARPGSGPAMRPRVVRSRAR